MFEFGEDPRKQEQRPGERQCRRPVKSWSFTLVADPGLFWGLWGADRLQDRLVLAWPLNELALASPLTGLYMCTMALLDLLNQDIWWGRDQGCCILTSLQLTTYTWSHLRSSGLPQREHSFYQLTCPSDQTMWG